MVNFEYPKTHEQWWESLDENWNNIKHLIGVYFPIKDKPLPGEEMRITAPMAERLRRNVIYEITNNKEKEADLDLRIRLEAWRNTKDRRLLGILEKTWWGIPESIEVRRIPGFYILCDLCSEGPDCLFDEEGENA